MSRLVRFYGSASVHLFSIASNSLRCAAEPTLRVGSIRSLSTRARAPSTIVGLPDDTHWGLTPVWPEYPPQPQRYASLAV